jgi:Domain of unknown function (DUF1707)
MMAGPSDEMAAAAAAHGRLRASHADREHVIDRLKAAFVQGLLDKDEFDLRMGQTFTSRTYAELAAVIASIPAGQVDVQPPPKPAGEQVQLRMKTALTWGAGLIIAAVIGMVAAFLTGNASIFLLSGLGFVAATVAAGTLIVESWDQKRSRGQLPQQRTPSAGGRASQRIASAAEGGQLPQIDRHQQHTAEAARSHPPRRQLPSSQQSRQRLWRAIAVQLAPTGFG